MAGHWITVNGAHIYIDDKTGKSTMKWAAPVETSSPMKVTPQIERTMLHIKEKQSQAGLTKKDAQRTNALDAILGNSNKATVSQISTPSQPSRFQVADKKLSMAKRKMNKEKDPLKRATAKFEYQTALNEYKKAWNESRGH